MNSSDESELDCTAKAVTLQLLPEQTKARYETEYTVFVQWCQAIKIGTPHSESVLLRYFTEMSQMKKSSTLWPVYSMLKATLSTKYNVDISKYKKLVTFLRKQTGGHKDNQSKILEKEEIRKFLLDAPDKIYLMWKVVLIFGVSGGCRCTELSKITLDDIEDTGSILTVNIPKSKAGMKRTFVVSNEDHLGIYRRYVSVRSKREKTPRRFFLGYKNGKCMGRVVGLILFRNIPAQIAAFLQLPDSGSYTGHCFRKSFTDADVDSIQRILVQAKPLNTPLTFAELQKELSQELDFVKHEMDSEVKVELEDNTERKIGKIPDIHSQSISETYNSDKTSVNLVNDILPISIKTEFGQKPYECTFCTSSFTKKIHLIVHTRQMHSAEKPYSCTECNKCFSEKYYLTKHIQMHSRIINVKPLSRSICTICNHSFKRKQNLTRHMRIHTGEKPYSCPVCDKQFGQKEIVARHMQTHTQEKLYSCTECDKTFKNKWSLKVHSQNHSDPLYVCTMCNSAITTKRNYARHMRAHNGEKPHSCTECTMQFSEKASLTRHIRMHTRGKSFSCSVCDSSFICKQLLGKHMRLHPVQKPYLCTVCKLAFRFKSHLAKHMRRHSGEKPYYTI